MMPCRTMSYRVTLSVNGTLEHGMPFRQFVDVEGGDVGLPVVFGMSLWQDPTSAVDVDACLGFGEDTDRSRTVGPLTHVVLLAQRRLRRWPTAQPCPGLAVRFDPWTPVPVIDGRPCAAIALLSSSGATTVSFLVEWGWLK